MIFLRVFIFVFNFGCLLILLYCVFNVVFFIVLLGNIFVCKLLNVLCIGNGVEVFGFRVLCIIFKNVLWVLKCIECIFVMFGIVERKLFCLNFKLENGLVLFV